MDEPKWVLLPCPFCGGICDGPRNYGDMGLEGPDSYHHARFVECRVCKANIYRHRESIELANTALIEAWNHRPSPPLAREGDEARNAALEEAAKILLGFAQKAEAEAIYRKTNNQPALELEEVTTARAFYQGVAAVRAAALSARKEQA